MTQMKAFYRNRDIRIRCYKKQWNKAFVYTIHCDKPVCNFKFCKT